MQGCKLTAVLLAVCMLLPVSVSAALPCDSIPYTLMGEDLQAWADDSLPAMAGEGGEWYAIALAQGEFSVDLTEYAVALTAFFAGMERQNPVEKQRCALALAAMGITEYAGQTAEETVGKQGIMSLIFGLHLLQNGGVCDSFTREGITEQLLSLQHEDGGWSLTGNYGDVDVTAMVLQALAMEKEAHAAVIEGGLAFLESKQQPGGGFKSYGVENSESASQVIIALAALGLDPRREERFAGVMEAWESYRQEDGRFAHVHGGEANGHASVQALLAYVALWRLENGLEGLYDFSSRTEELPEVSLPSENEISRPSVESVSVPEGDSSQRSEGLPFPRVAVLCLASVVALGCGVFILLPRRKK